MERDTSEAERDRLAHRQAQRHLCAAKRSATSSCSREETAQRRHQRQRAESEDREAAGAATATKDKVKYVARLYGEEAAAEIMRTRPTRCPPDVVLEHPHQADPQYHQDWTTVAGSNWDSEKWELEQRLRERSIPSRLQQRRNILIQASLNAGRSVFYQSSGNSMWPLVQSGDACTLHPIQAVTAKEGKFSIQKEASEIDVRDIVFCQVQPSQQFYAHIVQRRQHCSQRPTYFIGNIQRRMNGWCYREHIFGIHVDVQVFSGGEYFSRPHPKTLFEKVSALVDDDRWNDTARDLCLPSRKAPSSGAQSSGQQR